MLSRNKPGKEEKRILQIKEKTVGKRQQDSIHVDNVRDRWGISTGRGKSSTEGGWKGYRGT